MGVDSRTLTYGTMGRISLVTPQLLTTYSIVGTVLQGKAVQFASTSKLTVSFSPAPMPEPGRLALLASGLLGLFWLGTRSRR